MYLTVLYLLKCFVFEWEAVFAPVVVDSRVTLFKQPSEAFSATFVFRYGGISVGGQLPVLDVDPKDIQKVLTQLGHMLNVTGVTPVRTLLQPSHLSTCTDPHCY